MQYQIAICDDSAEILCELSAAVRKWAEKEKIHFLLENFSSAEPLLFRSSEKPDFDILLLDIEMPGMNGIELAKKIRQKNDHLQIIFITGFPDFIAEGYEVSALHYLMKPVSEEKLFQVLSRAAEKLQKAEKAVLLQTEGEIRRVPLNRIVSVEAFAHSCIVTTEDTSLEIKESITTAEKMLREASEYAFVRTHRSYLVGVRYIQSISKTDVTLDNGRKIPLSRGNYGAIHQAFIRFFKGESRWD